MPFSNDDLPSLPSMPTVRAGDARDAHGRIDHYDLLRKLGGGGFGVVYLARDSVSGVEVAIKTLHPLLKANAEEMDALREKFRLVSRLTHTNIAKALVLHPVRDVNVWDKVARQELRLSPGDSVMVMDYAPGVTLSKWRRQLSGGASRSGEPTVPLPLVLEIGRQLASALDYAHGERIVHRDVKPSNVMVETLPVKEEVRSTKDEGKIGPSTNQLSTNQLSSFKIRARILDFGLAAEIRSSMSRVSSETGDTSGTRPYMAPEQWLGRKQDGRTDQYALACVLYELLSGEPPFAGVFETGDPVIMRTAVVSDPPEKIEGAPPHVNAALRKALAKDPKDRFPSCSAFIEALANPEFRPPTRNPVPETRTPQAASPSETELFLRQAKQEKAMAGLRKDHASDQYTGTQWIPPNPPQDKAGQKLPRFWTLRTSVLVIWAIPIFSFLGFYIRQLLWKHSSWHTPFGKLQDEWLRYVHIGVVLVVGFVCWLRLLIIECRCRKGQTEFRFESRFPYLVMLAFSFFAWIVTIVLFANSRDL